MQALNWDIIKNNFVKWQAQEIKRREYVRMAWYAISIGLSFAATQRMPRFPYLRDDLLDAKGSELMHPKFDEFFRVVTEEMVLMRDFDEVKEMLTWLVKTDRIPYPNIIAEWNPEIIDEWRNSVRSKLRKSILQGWSREQ